MKSIIEAPFAVRIRCLRFVAFPQLHAENKRPESCSTKEYITLLLSEKKGIDCWHAQTLVWQYMPRSITTRYQVSIVLAGLDG